MKKLAILALGVAITGSALAQDVWYGGDFDGVNGYFSNHGPDIFNWEGLCYDDFTWNSSGNANYIFGTIFADNAVNVDWEIRSGMSTTSLGTLIASGTGAGNFVLLGNAFGFGYHRFNTNIGSVALTNGNTYWLGVGTNTNGASNSLGAVATTGGVNGIGSPLGDNDMLQHNATNNTIANTGTNGSLGIGTVPEPATMAVLGLGIVPFLRRRRK